MTDGHDLNKITLYAYRTARLSQLQDSFSQPGNIRHRPSLVAIHQNDDMNIVLESMMQRKSFLFLDCCTAGLMRM